MPPKKKPAAGQTPVDAIKHQDKRTNIPTEELRDFVAADEEKPATMLYPRDTSLDPQLVWRGKDAQDHEDLAVPVVPIYIQEKIHPQALIEDLRREVAGATPGPPQASLFADFNGIEFEDLVDFYQHRQNWANRMILGESTQVMCSLAQKEALKGQVQMIYVDPPYGIKFGSNWQVSTRKRDVTDGKLADLTRQPEQVKAFRDTWELGIHSYLAWLRDLLTVARELLTDTGSVFVQIGDENVHLVRCVLDEVFGSENFVSQISFRTTTNLVGSYLGSDNNHLLMYAKSYAALKYRQLLRPRTYADDVGGRYTRYLTADGARRTMATEERADISLLPAGARIYRHGGLSSQGATATGTVPFAFEGVTYMPEPGRHWSTTPEGLARLGRGDRLAAPTPRSLTYVRYLDDYPVGELTNVWTDTMMGAFTDDKLYIVQTNTKIVERCLLMTTDPGDLVLDPTCGSGTTAFVAEQWGRRWITVDTSRVALALARTRLMAARYPWYKLADDNGGGAQVPALQTGRQGDIKQGFKYKTVPHITLKSIANNEELDEIHARWQEQLEPLRAELNAVMGTQWEEWEVPRELPGGTTVSVVRAVAAVPDDPPLHDRDGHATEAEAMLAQWWDLRRQRQAEIDASIAGKADTETLYDQPEVDNKRVRVSGPFTVESLSPHRVLSATEELPRSEQEGKRASGPGQFETMILENLQAAGVQNTIKADRLHFDRLEPFAGEYLHAVGEYTEKGGATRRVAVCIGPEHGTVGAQLIKEAAKEAVRGVGFDTLIVCGFAFDPHVSEEAKEYGKLTVLTPRMNPDLALGDEVLKKTGSGNLFMIFGEPDLEVRQVEGKVQVEIKGLDIFDPTTGEIRSHTTDDIACWFIDTNYNEESFFVRHAYFTGAEEPYDKLKRALRADIDEGAWAALYSTTSRPFDPPATGKIAVKVINHYGDEVLKVYAV